MKKKNLLERFKSFPKGDWVLLVSAFLLDICAFVFSIGFSVKIGEGKTLFGDTKQYASDIIETKGPTTGDIEMLVLFWIVAVLLLAYIVYALFSQKQKEGPIVHKDIMNGRTIIIEEEEKKDDSKGSDK